MSAVITQISFSITEYRGADREGGGIVLIVKTYEANNKIVRLINRKLESLFSISDLFRSS